MAKISLVGAATVCILISMKAATAHFPATQASKLTQSNIPQNTVVNCGDSQSQTLMNQCFANEAEQLQILLDVLLKELDGRLDATQKERLEKVQSQWIEYKDEHCQWQSALSEGGSVRSTTYSTCIISLTWNRIEELKLDLCEGFGMTGSCEASKRYDRPSKS
jgi:uncharacterized protein YecT (DUF1311 family)